MRLDALVPTVAQAWSEGFPNAPSLARGARNWLPAARDHSATGPLQRNRARHRVRRRRHGGALPAGMGLAPTVATRARRSRGCRGRGRARRCRSGTEWPCRRDVAAVSHQSSPPLQRMARYAIMAVRNRPRGEKQVRFDQQRPQRGSETGIGPGEGRLSDEIMKGSL